jgi:hypothetical protein
LEKHEDTPLPCKAASVVLAASLQNTNRQQDVSVELYTYASLQNTNQTTRRVCGTIHTCFTAEHKPDNKKCLWNYTHMLHCRTQTRQQDGSVELAASLQNTKYKFL